MVELDCDTFERVLTNAIQKEGLETVYRNYLVTFLDRIGVLWMVGTITPVQEHFVSNVIRQKLIVETDKLPIVAKRRVDAVRSEEHTSELQSRPHLVCRLLLEKKK